MASDMGAGQPQSATPTMLVVTRRFAMPAEVVFDAWLDPVGIGRWLFATKEGAMVKVEADPRVGGQFTVVEKRGDAVAEHFGTYLEIDRPRRLVFSFATDREQNPTRVTVEITPVGGVCELRLSHEMDPKWVAYTDRAVKGWTMILDSLAALTEASDRVIISTRLLDTPRERVWKAFTDPNHVIHWWGPSGFTNTISEMDVKPGGVWRFVMHGPDGADYPNLIRFMEVVRPGRLVYSHGDDANPEQFLVTATLEEVGMQTRLTLRGLFASAEECETHRKFGAVEGGKQMLEKLAAYLPKM